MSAPDLNDKDQTGRISAMLDKLQDGTGLLVWCNAAKDRDVLHQEIQKVHRHIIILKGDVGMPVPTDFRCCIISPAEGKENYTHWVRDPFLCRRGNSQSIEVLKSSGAKLEDQLWSEKYLGKVNIGNTPVTVNTQIYLPVSGGNLLFDHDFILVGHHQFRRHIKDGDIAAAKAKLLNALSKYGQFSRVITVGRTALYEPFRLPHIDLYINLVGCGYKSYPQQHIYTMLLGECCTIWGDQPPNADINNIVVGINRYLEAVKDQLIEEGFDIRRIPLPLIAGDHQEKGRLCSFNNCLVERCAEGNKVWLPRYTYNGTGEPWYPALISAEEQVSAVWDSLGYDVYFVDADFHSILDENGSLHCITQEIWREQI